MTRVQGSFRFKEASEGGSVGYPIVLRSIQARRSVYLMAPMISESEMEPLGIAYASKTSDIERLTHGPSAVVVIQSAQY